MRLNKIVLSGANEFTDAGALAEFGRKHELAEIGIQVSGDKAFFAQPDIGGFIRSLFTFRLKIAWHCILIKTGRKLSAPGKFLPNWKLFLNSGITMENRFLKEYSLISKSDGKKRRIWIHCWQQ